MNKQILTGLTSALLVASISVAYSSRASQDQPSTTAARPEAKPDLSLTSNASLDQVVKVGEPQTSVERSDSVIAQVYSHELSGRKAVTLYVRKIPVMTFVGEALSSSKGVKVATAQDAFRIAKGSTTNPAQDPFWRATTVAARINQLNQPASDAKNINAVWDKTRQLYVIRLGTEQLVELNAQTRLPGKTNDAADAALQMTNRLRRQVGNAAPLRDIPGKPKPIAKTGQQFALGPIRFRINGMASWYGPGFHGNSTASGERFNQYALTAAHPNLPFGTQARVTNLDNGRSVVVRINDRGPYAHGRVLDLSQGAAQVLGVVSSGVAPVQIDVLGRR